MREAMSERESRERALMVNRLRRIEGQVRALSEMVSKGRPCEDVAQQMSATRRALERAYFHMMSCSLMEAMSHEPMKEGAQSNVQKMVDILQKYA